jgi:hypothetical protein
MKKKFNFWKRNWDIILAYLMPSIFFALTVFSSGYDIIGWAILMLLSVMVMGSIVVIKSLSSKNKNRIYWMLPHIILLIFILIRIAV